MSLTNPDSPSKQKRRQARQHKVGTKTDRKSGKKKNDHPAVSVDRVTGKVLIDPEALGEAAMTMASYDSLAIIFKTTPEYLLANFGPFIEECRERRKLDLRSAQFYTAIEQRNVVMQIWLGKQYLGQMDKSRVEQTGAGGGPIQQESTRKVIAYIPDNHRDNTKKSTE